MDTDFRVDFLDHCASFCYHNSIASDAKRAAHVVTIDFLTSCLIEKFTYVYINVIQQYGTPEEFFKTAGREIMRSHILQHRQAWNFEIMTVSNYYNDKRYHHHYFTQLNEQLPDDTVLFVFYKKEDKRRFEHERAMLKKKQWKSNELTDKDKDQDASTIREILELCELPTELFYTKANILVNRLQKLIDQVWPNMGYKVVIFGSAANRLGLQDADIDLCIVTSSTQYEKDIKRYRNRLVRIPNSVYNMNYLAKQLRSIGMRNIEPISNATVPICKFYDASTGLQCDINTHNVLGIENTRMIGHYADLDPRIRPFLTAIKYFVKQKDINNPRGGTLSSYAYVLMALHFLMAGLERPVIPSLQHLSVRCMSRTCNSKAMNKIIPLFHNHHIIECDARYHDCVRIQRRGMSAANQSAINQNSTIWEGYNEDSLSKLVTKFFTYYATGVNYVVSIITEDCDSYGNFDMDCWQGQPFIIQDPFILTKNAARSCTSIGAKAILREFQRAAELLRQGVSFTTVCDKKYNFPRPLDVNCLEYRIQNQKQRRAITHEIKKQHKEIRLQSQQPDKTKMVSVSQDQVIGYLEDNNSRDEQLFEWITPDLLDNEDQEDATKIELPTKAEVPTEAEMPTEAEVTAKSIFAELTESFFGSNYGKDKNNEQRTVLPTYFPLEFPAIAKDNEEEEPETSANESDGGVDDTSSAQEPKSPSSLFHTTSLSSRTADGDSLREDPNSVPILNLVKKLVSYQPRSSLADDMDGEFLHRLTTQPCTDMQQLLDDPCMVGVDMKDICYLVAQLNFLGDTVAQRILNRGEPMVEKPMLSAHTGLDSLYEKTKPLSGDEDGKVVVFFTVENVPVIFDAYVVYTEFYWYGQVLNVFPAETWTNPNTGTTTTKWNVYMKLTYEDYQNCTIPRKIQFNVDGIDDYLYVSKPILTS
ncbi:MAG: hypothetical protein EXX96DRAFT_578784 [Benjaminiella poitrasii]|nr:MAG: hypothetical protein EXX96DRAFT_578784 [Benjaminiella poitrasii]